MRLRHIEVFHAVYTTGSITSAARLLYVSQPSISKVLAHAELQLGFALFQRNRGKLIATPEAHMLFGEVDKIYRQLHAIRNMSDNIQRSEQGLVNMAISPALGFDLIPRAIAEFRRSHPKVHFNLQILHNEEAQQALLEHKCDLALLYASPSMPEVAEEVIGNSEMVLVYPKSQFNQPPEYMPVEQLSELELIDISQSGPLGRLLEQALQQAKVAVNTSIQVDTYYVAASLVAHGQGNCVIDKLSALGNANDALGMAPLHPPIAIPLKALYLEGQPLAKINADFCALLRGMMAQLH